MRSFLCVALLCVPSLACAGLFVAKEGPVKLGKGEAYTVSAELYTYPGADTERPERAEFWLKDHDAYSLYVICRDGSKPQVYDPYVDTKNPPPQTPYRVICP